MIDKKKISKVMADKAHKMFGHTIGDEDLSKMVKSWHTGFKIGFKEGMKYNTIDFAQWILDNDIQHGEGGFDVWMDGKYKVFSASELHRLYIETN